MEQDTSNFSVEMTPMNEWIVRLEEYKGGFQVGVPKGVWVEHAPTGMKAFSNFATTQHKNRWLAYRMVVAGLELANVEYTEMQ